MVSPDGLGSGTELDLDPELGEEDFAFGGGAVGFPAELTAWISMLPYLDEIILRLRFITD